MANRFWVGGTGTWDASDTTHWAATSGGAGGQSVPGSSDSAVFDASSGGGTVTVNTNFSIISLTCGAFTGTLDFATNNNSPSMSGVFNGAGTGTRTLNMGSGIWTVSGNSAAIFDISTATNLTLNPGTSIVRATYSGSTGTRTIRTTTNVAIYDVQVTAGTDTLAIGNLFAHSLDMTGFSGTGTFAGGWNLSGSVTFSATQTITDGANTLTMSSTGAASITTNGVVLGMSITMDGVGGTFTLQDNLNLGSTTVHNLRLNNGSFNANNKNITCGTWISSSGTTRSITMGSGTWTLTSTGNVWNTSAANFTITPNTSTIKITDATSTSLTFIGSGKIYNNIWFSRGVGTGTNTITGANTFNDFKDDTSVAHIIIFPASTVTTVTTFTVSGSSGNVITLNSSSGGTAWTLSCASGVINRSYLTIQDSKAQGGANFYAANSTSTSGNTGWQFFAANTITNTDFFYMF